MKVLLLIQNLNFGGLEKLTFDLAINICKAKREVEVCCYDDLGYFAEELKREGINVHLLLRKPGIDMTYPFKLASLVKRRRVDLIHAHNATAWFYGTLASVFSRVPIVYTEHGRLFPSRIRLRILNYFLGKRSSVVVAVSKAVKENLEKYEHIHGIHIVYNGVDPTLFHPVTEKEKSLKRKELGILDTDIILGNVGRLDYWKNQGILIKVLPHIKKYVPNVKLVFVGCGNMEDTFKELVREEKLELGNDVVFLGKRCDVYEILKAIDIFVFPSLTEGLPLAVIEAMGTGLPVIASPVGGIPELIDHDINGFLVSPTSEEEIKDAILKILKNQDLAQKLGKRAREKFETQFSLPYMIENYLRIYEMSLS